MEGAGNRTTTARIISCASLLLPAALVCCSRSLPAPPPASGAAADAAVAAAPFARLDLPAAHDADADSGAGSALDKPFPDAGNCWLTPRVLALPPSNGHCDTAACSAAGGVCVWGGMSCIDVCARRTGDGGKTCHDNSECEAGCVTDQNIPKGSATSGICQTSKVGFGCFNAVVHGVAQGGICAD
jgi:hypothetical protein